MQTSSTVYSRTVNSTVNSRTDLFRFIADKRYEGFWLGCHGALVNQNLPGVHDEFQAGTGSCSAGAKDDIMLCQFIPSGFTQCMFVPGELKKAVTIASTALRISVLKYPKSYCRNDTVCECIFYILILYRFSNDKAGFISIYCSTSSSVRSSSLRILASKLRIRVENGF